MPVTKWEKDTPVPLNLPAIPSMLSENEKNFLYWFVAHEWEGEGEIVELGCYLGSSTAIMISALNENKRIRNPKLHTYDRFIWGEVELDYWHKFQSDTAKDKPNDQYKIGGSFEPLFRQHISMWEDQIQIHSGDVLTQTWDDTPIGFLFVDLMKTQDLAIYIVQQFFTSLIPGKSYIYHQDFYSPDCSWIHLLMYRLRTHFEPVYAIEDGGVLYLCTKEITTSDAVYACDFNQYTLAEINAAFEYSLSQITDTRDGHQWRISASMLFAHLHAINQIPSEHKKRALSFPTVKNYASKIFQINSELAVTENYPQISYMVCATPRSGSTMVCEMLGNSNLVGKPREYFYRGGIPNYQKQYGLSDNFRDYVTGIVRKTMSEGRVFGFKIMYDHLVELIEKLAGPNNSQPDVLESFFPNLRYIYIIRRNKLAQAISFVKAKQTDVWWLPKDNPNIKPKGELTYDLEAIHNGLQWIIEQDTNWQAYFAKYSINPLVLYYEDIREDHQKIKVVLDYLGVAYPENVTIQAKTLQQSDRTDREWLVRYLHDRGYLPESSEIFSAVRD